jgi:hypothetical protein
MMIGGSFVVQWGIGVVAEAAAAAAGLDAAGGLRARSRSCSPRTSWPSRGSRAGWRRHAAVEAVPARA